MIIASYWPTVEAASKKQWGPISHLHNNLIWTQRNEEWFQKRLLECTTGGECGQPKPQSKWKRYGFDVPFEDYSAKFLDAILLS